MKQLTGATKICPECAEEIKQEAILCHFCRAEFNVTQKGYCSACHDVVDLNASGRCDRCEGEVVDRRVDSELKSGESTPASPPSPADVIPEPTPVVQGELREGIEFRIRHQIGAVAIACSITVFFVISVLGTTGQLSAFRLGSTSVRYLKPPIGLFLVPLIMCFFLPRLLLQKKWRFFRGLKARASRARLRKDYGLGPLYRRAGLVRNLIVAAGLLVLVAIILVGAVGTLNDTAGAHFDPGMTLAFIALGVGSLGLGLMVPTRSDRVVRIDDSGDVYM